LNLAGNAEVHQAGGVRISVVLDGDHLVYGSATRASTFRPSCQNVFAEFRQVDATVTRQFGGAG
jgi:hypothetical protein